MIIKNNLLAFIVFMALFIYAMPAQSSITLNVGETYTCNLGYVSNFKECVWTSSDTKAIDFVDRVTNYSTSITVKAIAKPSYITPVTVHCQYYYYDLDPTTGRYTYLRSGYKDFQFFINDNGPTSISVHPSSLTLDIGKTRTLSTTITPSSADQTVTWSTSDYSVASVSQYGEVLARGSGEARITATTINGKTAHCNVFVNYPKPTGINVTPSSIKLPVGTTRQLSYSLTPINSETKVTWDSSNTSVASVSSSGLVSALSEGNAIITATTENGYSAKSEISVVQSIAKITLDDKTIYEGYSVQLVPETEPKNAVTDCSWKSSDSKVAKVDQNGIVTAIKAGTTKIMVTTINNKTATATITVKQPSENENVKMAKARINLTRNLINKSRQ